MATYAARAGHLESSPIASERQPRVSFAGVLSPSNSELCLRASARVAPVESVQRAIPESRISMFVVRRLVEAIEREGVSRQDVLQVAGLTEEALAEADTGVPRHLVERICDFALQPTVAPALGLSWAEGMTPHTFGPVSHTLVHTASLRQAFELVLQYQGLFCDQRIFALEEEGDKAILRLAEWDFRSARVRRFADEMTLTGFQVMMHSYDASIERVCFSHAAPDHHAVYTRVFGSVVQFDQPFSGIVFQRSLLDRKNPYCDSEVRTALTDVLERRLVRATQDAPYSLRVRELLIRESPKRLGIEHTARKLGLSERSLRRRLAAEGVSFREIQHGVLAFVAEQFLQEKRFTTQETAHAMGFSDASAFHRAFRRWTGTTPRAFGAP